MKKALAFLPSTSAAAWIRRAAHLNRGVEIAQNVSNLKALIESWIDDRIKLMDPSNVSHDASFALGFVLPLVGGLRHALFIGVLKNPQTKLYESRRLRLFALPYQIAVSLESFPVEMFIGMQEGTHLPGVGGQPFVNEYLKSGAMAIWEPEGGITPEVFKSWELKNANDFLDVLLNKPWMHAYESRFLCNNPQLPRKTTASLIVTPSLLYMARYCLGPECDENTESRQPKDPDALRQAGEDLNNFAKYLKGQRDFNQGSEDQKSLNSWEMALSLFLEGFPAEGSGKDLSKSIEVFFDRVDSAAADFTAQFGWHIEVISLLKPSEKPFVLSANPVFTLADSFNLVPKDLANPNLECATETYSEKPQEALLQAKRVFELLGVEPPEAQEISTHGFEPEHLTELYYQGLESALGNILLFQKDASEDKPLPF